MGAGCIGGMHVRLDGVVWVNSRANPAWLSCSFAPMMGAWTGIWLATSVEAPPLGQPDVCRRWQALIVWRRVAPCWPSLLEWRVSPSRRPNDGPLGDGMADPVVRLLAGFEAEKRLRGGRQRVVADIGEVAPSAEPHMVPQASRQTRIARSSASCVTSRPRRCSQASITRHGCCAMHDTTELPRAELCQARLRHGLTATGLVEGPARVRTPSCARPVLVLARRHTLIDRRQAR